MEENELIFWKDVPEGETYSAEGGFFIRNDLKTFLNELIKSGREPVGIKINLDNFNIEIMVKE
jgi:hypothetical protein